MINYIETKCNKIIPFENISWFDSVNQDVKLITGEHFEPKVYLIAFNHFVDWLKGLNYEEQREKIQGVNAESRAER